MFSLARTFILNTTKRLCPTYTNPVGNFHALVSQSVKVAMLTPETTTLIPSCGFKVKGHLTRRCKDCYFVRRQERLYVICKTHGRHKQMSMVKDPRNTWILTHATQSKIRPW